MIRIAILSVAILVMAIAIAQSENRSVTAQTPDNKPEIREAPTATATPTLVPKREAEQEYAAGADCASGGETGDSSGCSGARGRPQYVPTSTPRPTATATPKPRPTATPKPKPTATPQPRATATPKPKPTATPRPSGGSSPGSGSRTTTLKPPPAPTGFVTKQGRLITHKGKNSLLVSWNRMRGVDHFRLLQRTDEDDPWVVHDRNITGTIKDVTNLKCGTTYYLALEAYGNGRTYKKEYSKTSARVTAKTTSCAPSLPEPSKFRYSCSSARPALPVDKNEPTKLARMGDGNVLAVRSVVYSDSDLSAQSWILRWAYRQLYPDLIIRCSFASAESATTKPATTNVVSAQYDGLRVASIGDQSTGDVGITCTQTTTCLWESDTLNLLLEMAQGSIYAKSTHEFKSGKYTNRIKTSNGMLVKNGMHVPGR